MISTVTMKAGRKTHKLKLSTGAQMRLERELKLPIGEILQQLLTGDGGVCVLIAALAACLQDGAGVEEEEAIAVCDAKGGATKVTPFLLEALQAAYPVLKDLSNKSADQEEGEEDDAPGKFVPTTD